MDTLLQAASPLMGAAFEFRASPVTWLEIAAFFLSVWMVLANMRVDPIAWPLAISASLLYALLFANSRLYGEASLQGFFIAIASWGWWQWLRGTDAAGHALAVSWLTPLHRITIGAATLAAWPLVGLLLDHSTDSDVPYLDALPTVASVTGQLLLGRKKVENWPVWLAVNVVSVGLFAYKELWLTVLLYALFAVMSVAGWRAWRELAERGAIHA